MSKSQLVHYHGIILHNHAVNNIKNMHSQLYVSVRLCTYVYIISSLNWTSSSYCPIDTPIQLCIILSPVFSCLQLLRLILSQLVLLMKTSYGRSSGLLLLQAPFNLFVAQEKEMTLKVCAYISMLHSSDHLFTYTWNLL